MAEVRNTPGTPPQGMPPAGKGPGMMPKGPMGPGMPKGPGGKEMTAEELRQLQQKNGEGGQRRGPGGPMIREKPKDAKAVIKKLLHYISKSKYLLLVILCTTLITTGLNLLGPMLQGKAIDAITIDLNLGKAHVDFDALVKCLTLMALVYVANSLVTILQGIASARISQTTVFTLREDLFRKISYLPIQYTDTHSHGDIMSRMTNDVDNISNSISQSISSLVSSVLTLIGALAMLIYYDWRMALVSLVTVPLTLLVSMNLSKFMRKYFVEKQVILGQQCHAPVIID